jgi:hypothetical protein
MGANTTAMRRAIPLSALLVAAVMACNKHEDYKQPVSSNGSNPQRDKWLGIYVGLRHTITNSNPVGRTETYTPDTAIVTAIGKDSIKITEVVYAFHSDTYSYDSSNKMGKSATYPEISQSYHFKPSVDSLYCYHAKLPYIITDFAARKIQ